MAEFYLGIDGGTTNIKAALLDEALQIIDQESCRVDALTPSPERSEADMNAYWESACHVLRALTSRNREKRLAGVGITAQGDGCWPIDRDGIPVRTAVLWNDTRAKALDLSNAAYRELAEKHHTNTLIASSMGAVLKWLKTFEPDRFSRIYKVLHCKDWLNYQLSGKIATDVTDASTTLTDLLQGAYVEEELDALGIPECAPMLPPIRESSDMLGEVLPEAAEVTGIPAGTPICVGGLDVCMSALGAGLTQSYQSCSIVGTTLANAILLPKQTVAAQELRLVVVRYPVPGMFLNLYSTLSGAASLDFARSLFCPNMSWSEIEAVVKETPPGCDGLVFHPYLRGERAPFTNPFAAGAFLGIRSHHTMPYFLRSVMEGVAFSYYDCYRSFPRQPDTVYLMGGAARNDTLSQMLADIGGVPCRRIHTAEAGILGATRNLRVALGSAADYGSFPAPSCDTFTPDFDVYPAMQAAYQRFRSLREALEPTYFRSNDFGQSR